MYEIAPFLVKDQEKSMPLKYLSDLIGLPPPIEDLNYFLNNPSFTAFAVLVDRLLASPKFGETWGRHWLDVARFAESSGGGTSSQRRSPARSEGRKAHGSFGVACSQFNGGAADDQPRSGGTARRKPCGGDESSGCSSISISSRIC